MPAKPPKSPKKLPFVAPGIQLAQGLHDAIKTANCLQFGLSKEAFAQIKTASIGTNLKGFTPNLGLQVGQFAKLQVGFQQALGKSLSGMDFGALGKWSAGLKLDFATMPKWEEIEALQSECSHELGMLGWFLSAWDSPVSYFPKILRLIKEDKWSVAENGLILHFEKIAPNIEKRLVSEFPKRREVLEEAFALYREKRYFASVSLMLTQSEGIGRDIFDASPVSTNPGQQAKIREWLEKHDRFSGLNTLANVIFATGLPISVHTTKLVAAEAHLNRHEVLHGLSASYGTRRNAVKAISWLEFVASFNFDLLRTMNEMSPEKWRVIRILPEIQMTRTFECRDVAIVPPCDERLKAAAVVSPSVS